MYKTNSTKRKLMRKLRTGSFMSRSEMTKQKKERKNARETSNVCPRKFALKDYNFPPFPN